MSPTFSLAVSVFKFLSAAAHTHIPSAIAAENGVESSLDVRSDGAGFHCSFRQLVMVVQTAVFRSENAQEKDSGGRLTTGDYLDSTQFAQIKLRFSRTLHDYYR